MNMTKHKTRVIEGIVMPGGWHKPEVDRAGRPLPQPIRAGTFDELVVAVTKFRADNLIPIGNVVQDCEDYICTNFPSSCIRVKGASVQVTMTRGPAATPTQRLTDDMLQWMDKVLDKHESDRLILPNEAKSRAEVCRKCPLNKQWNISCGSCTEQVGRLGTAIRLGHDTPWGKKLYACTAARFECRSAVWLRHPLEVKPDGLPGHCWL
jgi:hypothetical protein